MFGLQGAGKVAAVFLAAAGGYSRCVAMGDKKLGHFSQRRRWLGQRVKAQFEELGVGQRRRRTLDQLHRRSGLYGHAEFAKVGQTGAQIGVGAAENELGME